MSSHRFLPGAARTRPLRGKPSPAVFSGRFPSICHYGGSRIRVNGRSRGFRRRKEETEDLRRGADEAAASSGASSSVGLRVGPASRASGLAPAASPPLTPARLAKGRGGGRGVDRRRWPALGMARQRAGRAGPRCAKGGHGEGHRPRPDEVVRRGAGDPWGRPRHRGRRVRGAGRAVGLRQVDAAQDDRRARGDHQGHDPDRRAGGQRPGAGRARHRDGVPELRALPAQDGAAEHGLRAEAAAHRQGRGRGAGRAGGGDPRARAVSRALSAAALGRAAAAGGDPLAVRRGRIGRRLRESIPPIQPPENPDEGPPRHHRAVGRRHLRADEAGSRAPEGARGRSADRAEGADRLRHRDALGEGLRGPPDPARHLRPLARRRARRPVGPQPADQGRDRRPVRRPLPRPGAGRQPPPRARAHLVERLARRRLAADGDHPGRGAGALRGPARASGTGRPTPAGSASRRSGRATASR